MSYINDAISAVIGVMNTFGLFATVTRGALPTGQGITCEIGPSSPTEVYLDKGLYIPIDLAINGKHANLQTLSDALNMIHDNLTRRLDYPSGTDWEIVDISNSIMPQIVGRENNNDWVMASSLTVKIHRKGA